MFLLQDVCSRYLSRKLCYLHVAFGSLFLDICAGHHVLQMLLIEAMFYKYLYCRLWSVDFHFEVVFSRCLFQGFHVDFSTRGWVLQISFLENVFVTDLFCRLCSLYVFLWRLSSLDISLRGYVLQPFILQVLLSIRFCAGCFP